MNQAALPPPPPPPPKPIRFVANHDGPYAKRRRINSACLTCRKKKTRCSGERPVCGTCLQNGHDCAGYGSEAVPSQALRTTREDAARLQSRVEAPIDPRLPSDSAANHAALHHHDQIGSSHGLSLSTRNRMPYFRYFGPTAIMPGFKQMVVKVRSKQHDSVQTPSSDHLASEPSPVQPSVASPPARETRTPLEIPVYDTSSMSPSPLITHLCTLFFTNLGCSFPFLQRERFLRDLEEKQVDAILVDAVCALASRFSTHSQLTGHPNHPKEGGGELGMLKLQPSEYGQAFAQRAKSAIPDAFPCPTVAIVQAALLLAYDEFGASRDSGLWMYLGIAIRMAQDLGMQTLQGLKLEGLDGPTPISIKTDPESIRFLPAEAVPTPGLEGDAEEQEWRAVERERLDTFWSIFFLDRVISSGTGRPVTLRDCDIEISFPSLDEVDSLSGWPLPFPALVRIIHLYGRVTDLLNRIKNTSDINDNLQKQLGALEDHLTLLYQNLSPRLHFNAINFQHYAKSEQGTNFLLLHYWFHTLIVLLHQPTLLKTFEGASQPLSTNSRELSMSSAKTVADILAFTEVIDPKSGMGNPFTSQPIYIAACAFLKETAIHSASSQPHSDPSSPVVGERKSDEPRSDEAHSLGELNVQGNPGVIKTQQRLDKSQERASKQVGKHTLLASAANQNYQRCYRALESLETYWAGVKYILTVLDQKATGVVDPLLYTREEMESALEMPRPEPSFTSPGWRRKLSWGSYLTTPGSDTEMMKAPASIRTEGRTSAIPGSPMINPNQAIGWSLTGTMHSPCTNLAVMYASENTNMRKAKPTPPKLPSIASVTENIPIHSEPSQSQPPPSQRPSFNHTAMPPPPQNQIQALTTIPDPVLVSDADLLLNLHSPFPSTSPRPGLISPPSYPPQTMHQTSPPSQSGFSPTFMAPLDQTYSNMLIDTQDVDMSVLGQDMMPWDLEYLPHDMLYFGDAGV